MYLQAATRVPQTQKDLPQNDLGVNVIENVVDEIVAVPTTQNSVQQDAKLKPAPAQEKSAEAISKMEKELCGLLTVERSGFMTPEMSKHMKTVEKNSEKEKLRLKKIEDSAVRSQKYRNDQRAKLDELR